MKKLKSYWFWIMAVWVGSGFFRKLAAIHKDSKQYEWRLDEDGLPAFYKKRHK